MISLTEVRAGLLKNGCIKNALVLDSSVTVVGIQSVLKSPVLPVIEGIGVESERELFQAIYMKMICPAPFEMKSIDLGGSRRLLVHLYPVCHIAVEVEIGHSENKSLRRFIRRLGVRHGLDRKPAEGGEPDPVAP